MLGEAAAEVAGATAVEDHYNPSVRVIDLEKSDGTQCGFHLTRSKWDPYPWVSSVDANTAAFAAGMKPGDCLLEVNGEDIVGHRISEIADIVKSKPNQVSLLLWNAGVDSQCSPEALCCGPMPANLQKLSACMSSILAFLECPVCLDTILPPTYQCDNGHLICIKCRAKSERCPVCRQRLNRARSLLADQIYNSLIDSFNLRGDNEETRSAKIQQIFKLKNRKNVPDIRITQSPSQTNKLLSRFLNKASSVDNLSSCKFLSPGLSENECHLKTKSLSTNEIFQSPSPAVSRSESMSRISRNEKNKLLNINNEVKSASCHGSLECLDRKIEDESTKSNLDSVKENPLYYCPFSANCDVLFNDNDLINHFQQSHNGPLVQYFQNQEIKLNLRKLLLENDNTYIIHINDNVFVLKVIQENSDILLWMWHLGNKNQSKDFDVFIDILINCDNNSVNNTLLSVRSTAFSLSTVSWQEIKQSKKIVFLSAKTLEIFNVNSNNVVLNVQIVKNDL